MNTDFVFENGDTVTDPVTKFSGVITGRADYISGCNQYCVQPPTDAGKWVDSRWFDEPRLLLVARHVAFVNTQTVKVGADDQAPTK